MSKRVLHIINGIGTGGAEQSLLRLMPASKRAGMQSIVLSLERVTEFQRQELFENEGACVISIEVPRGTFALLLYVPFLIFQLRRFVRALEPDVICGWMYHGALVSLIAARLSPKRVSPLLFIRRSLYSVKDLRPATRFILRALARFSHSAKAIVYNSNVSKLQHEAFGLKDGGVVISNGVPIHDFVPSSEERNSFALEQGLSSDVLLIGHVGRFVPEKDHRTALETFAILTRREPRLRFVCIGRGVQQSNREFAQLCERAGFDLHLPDCPLLLLGERADLQKLLPAFDLLFSSSISEGFSNVIAESMSCQVPCVVTDVGESATIVGETGRVLSVSEPQEAAKHLLELLSLSAETRRQLGEQARERVCERYSVERFCGEVLGLFE